MERINDVNSIIKEQDFTRVNENIIKPKKKTDRPARAGCEGFLDKDIRRLQEMGNGQTDDENWK